ncbi:hypothetical protein E4U21_007787 [Claviceps maximensis]|nr:hypothetical protein E4U21_007787 [Claviceps maximensis]
MTTAAQPVGSFKIRGQRKRKVADVLLETHQSLTSSMSASSRTTTTKAKTKTKTPETPSIRIVCISDTHNKQPTLPPGDILIHAGDLTENGSFEEVQRGLRWLSSQPHRYKVFVAGNHDVLFHDAFLEKYPERRYGQTLTKRDLDWGSVTYLQDSLVTLDIPVEDREQSTTRPAQNTMRTDEDFAKAEQHSKPSITRRSITIFGSPWTPRYGVSAFQYHPSDAQHWGNIFASLDNKKPQIVVTHGPPHLHLDRRDFHRAGCPHLAEEIHRIRPRLCVFGHIHASYGREDSTLDGIQRIHEEVSRGWAGWGGIMWMATMVLWARVRHIFSASVADKSITFVNAAVVGGPRNELQNAPIVVDL